MRIVSKSTLKDFWKRHTNTEQVLKEWYNAVKEAEWNSHQDVVNQFANARIIKGSRVIFNIKGNQYRLVVIVKYKAKKVYIRFIGTHEDYDNINVEEV